MQGIATSIDALAVGVSFAALENVNIAFAATAICSITFMFSIVGVLIGKKFGNILNNKAQLVGGLILVGIGVKIFVEHTFFNNLYRVYCEEHKKYVPHIYYITIILN